MVAGALEKVASQNSERNLEGRSFGKHDLANNALFLWFVHGLTVHNRKFQLRNAEETSNSAFMLPSSVSEVQAITGTRSTSCHGYETAR